MNGFYRVINSAKVQTAVGTFLGLLFTVMGVAPDSIALWLALVAGGFALAVAVIAAWAYEDGQLKAPIDPAAANSSATKPLLILMLATLPLLAGCQGREIGIAQEAYRTTGEKLIAAREQGKISDKVQIEIIAPAREAAKAIIDQMVEDYLAGRDFNWRASILKFNDAMTPLLRQRRLLEVSTDG